MRRSGRDQMSPLVTRLTLREAGPQVAMVSNHPPGRPLGVSHSLPFR